MLLAAEPQITSFLVKVTSRCNLNCDYCYVFNHTDQSWKSRPPLMSEAHRTAFAKRLAEYISAKNLKNCLVVFHGGEPLLIGANKIVEMVEEIRKLVPAFAEVDFSLQTNGVLLKKKDLDLFEKWNIGVSLSLDGPKHANDLHRLTHKNKSSYEDTLKAFNLLKQYPKVFTGVISVVDVRIEPEELFHFFDELSPPGLDFLLPDSNHLTPPPYRDTNPNIYKEWLLKAFDLWIDKYPNLEIRTFDSLLATMLGEQSKTDFFGFGDISLLTIETDGVYHDLDVLKITQEGVSELGMNVKDHSILEASVAEKVQNHRNLLTLNGLSNTCKTCPVVAVCAGGSVPHRFAKNGFENPTIYCQEMLSLIQHAQERLSSMLELDESIEDQNHSNIEEVSFDTITYNQAGIVTSEFSEVYDQWREKERQRFLAALEISVSIDPSYEKDILKILNVPKEVFLSVAKLPGVHLWTDVLLKHKEGLKLYNLDENLVPPQLDYIKTILSFLNQKQNEFQIHLNDPWLRYPFGKQIIFEEQSFREAGLQVVQEAFEIIKAYNPAILDEMLLISPVIQFIQDPTADPDKLVSFSDNSVPGALYICLRQSQGLASPYDIADSLIHEYRHQKLYLLQEYLPIVVQDFPYVSSPWREEPRPVSGLYHAVFVFHDLEKYWRFLSESALYPNQKAAEKQAKINKEMMLEGLKTLKGCEITSAGRSLLNYFEGCLQCLH